MFFFILFGNFMKFLLHGVFKPLCFFNPGLLKSLYLICIVLILDLPSLPLLLRLSTEPGVSLLILLYFPHRLFRLCLHQQYNFMINTLFKPAKPLKHPVLLLLMLLIGALNLSLIPLVSILNPDQLPVDSFVHLSQVHFLYGHLAD